MYGVMGCVYFELLLTRVFSNSPQASLGLDQSMGSLN